MALMKLPCYCGTLRQASRAITALYDEHLREVDIRATQFNLLQALKFKPGARNADLVEWLAIDQTTMTRNLEVLRKNRLVEVTGRPSGREKYWSLTAKGETLNSRAEPLWLAAQAEVRRRLGAKQTQILHTDAFGVAELLTGHSTS